MARRHPIMKLLRMKVIRDFCMGFLLAGVVLVIFFVELLNVQPKKTPASQAAAQTGSPPGGPPAMGTAARTGMAASKAPAAGPVLNSDRIATTGEIPSGSGAAAVVQKVQRASEVAAPGQRRKPSLQRKRFADAPSIDSRVYFPDMLGETGLSGTQGIEVGAAKGRFSDFLLHRWLPKHWVLIDPVLLPQLDENLNRWRKDPILKSAKIEFLQGYSTDQQVLSKIPETSFDFIYIDAAHDYDNVKKELPFYWKRLRTGGLMAGHDYCGKKDSVAKLPKDLVKGRPNIRTCGPYTDFAAKNPTASGKIRKEGGEARDQTGVVRALLEWLQGHPEVELRATSENFTRETLARDNINYDDIITTTRNPSWYMFKPR